MQTIEMKALVGPDRKLVVQLPLSVSPGEHCLVVVIDEPASGESKRPALTFTAYPVGLVSDSLTFRREDLYGDPV
jgi:hypothetical protein